MKELFQLIPEGDIAERDFLSVAMGGALHPRPVPKTLPELRTGKDQSYPKSQHKHPSGTA